MSEEYLQKHLKSEIDLQHWLGNDDINMQWFYT
jgi:hypothetical protein